MTESETLEEKIDADIFNYHPINPNEEYDRKKFVGAQGELNDLGEYNETLQKDPYDIGAREGLSVLLVGDPTFHNGKAPEEVINYAKTALSSGLESMTKYVARNEDKFFDMLDGEALKSLVLQNLELYKTGNKEYDDLGKCRKNGYYY